MRVLGHFKFTGNLNFRYKIQKANCEITRTAAEPEGKVFDLHSSVSSESSAGRRPDILK